MDDPHPRGELPCEHFTDDSTGVSAADACPVSCLTGCALTFDSCSDGPCQNGGVCTNRPGVEAFSCDCASHYGGPACETYCGPDQDCVSLAEHICATLCIQACLTRACAV